MQTLVGNSLSDPRVVELLSRVNMDITHLSAEEQQTLKLLLASYVDVCTKIEQLVQEMLEQRVIEPSESPWVNPIVPVQKRDGRVRFCVDYRKLNPVTKLDEFPLPRIDDTLDHLTGSRHFSTLHLASGYWQVELDPSFKEKTAFTTYSGLWKMPFGLLNAPVTFQRLMEVVLAGLVRSVCVVYLEGILVFGNTVSEHNSNLTQVRQRLNYASNQRNAILHWRRWSTLDTLCQQMESARTQTSWQRWRISSTTRPQGIVDLDSNTAKVRRTD